MSFTCSFSSQRPGALSTFAQQSLCDLSERNYRQGR
jgi:hypothetical protein